MWENTCATTHPAAQSLPPNSTSMDALVVGLAPKKSASKNKMYNNIASLQSHIASNLQVSVYFHQCSHPLQLLVTDFSMLPSIIRCSFPPGILRSGKNEDVRGRFFLLAPRRSSLFSGYPTRVTRYFAIAPTYISAPTHPMGVWDAPIASDEQYHWMLRDCPRAT